MVAVSRCLDWSGFDWITPEWQKVSALIYLTLSSPNHHHYMRIEEECVLLWCVTNVMCFQSFEGQVFVHFLCKGLTKHVVQCYINIIAEHSLQLHVHKGTKKGLLSCVQLYLWLGGGECWLPCPWPSLLQLVEWIQVWNVQQLLSGIERPELLYLWLAGCIGRKPHLTIIIRPRAGHCFGWAHHQSWPLVFWCASVDPVVIKSFRRGQGHDHEPAFCQPIFFCVYELFIYFNAHIPPF